MDSVRFIKEAKKRRQTVMSAGGGAEPGIGTSDCPVKKRA